MDEYPDQEQLKHQESAKMAKKPKNSLPATSMSILQTMINQQRVPPAASSSNSTGSGEFSTDGILKKARECLNQSNNNNQKVNVASILVGDLFHTDPTVPPQKSDDFELALLFQAVALKFSNQQFDRARWLLNICQSSVSPSGNALHRIVSCFCAALQERIARELGGGGGQFSAVAREGNLCEVSANGGLTDLHAELIKIYPLLPFCQVTDLTAIQALVDNVASAKRVHLIDLGIVNGSQWPLMMQALAARHDCNPLELLKLTAIGTSENNEVGKRLSSFASSMNIPFEFKLIVSDLKDLREDLFELSDDEVLAVYSELCLAKLLPSPDHLVSLLGTIEKLNPCVMVVTEIEASTDSPVFLNRFDGALSVCAAVFDCLEDVMERDNPCRSLVERGFVQEIVLNVITCEGEERVSRHERLDFWRAFLSRFGFVEVSLSSIAFCQLDLVLRNNPSWGSCTVEKNGKGIVVGWKGSPIKSLSLWKFQHDQ